MEHHRLVLTVLPESLAVCRFAQNMELPAWALTAPFYSITRTADELSIVCPEEIMVDTRECERGWRALKVAGPLDFSLTGVLATLTGPLAQAGISVFVISTYDTDYLLVKAEQLVRAVAVLAEQGHTISGQPSQS